MEDTSAIQLDTKITTLLAEDHSRITSLTLGQLFEANPNRFQTMKIECADLVIDFSKHLVDEQTLKNLSQLASLYKLEDAQKALFSGDAINNTENRAALHTALRAPAKQQPEDVKPLIAQAREKLFSISKKINSGEWKGFNGDSITNVVNIGIGGSDLGPAMTVEALNPYHVNPKLSFHFVSNIDPSDLKETLKACRPETTLFIVASKTFTTQETLTNAKAAKEWLLSAYQNNIEAIQDHFIAISTNLEKVKAFGISETSVLPMWDWVGGRYSIWSAISLPLCTAIGNEQFQEFLDGAYRVDQHFLNSPPTSNAPCLMALLSIWYSEFFGCDSQGILCYEHFLDKFPDYLQQLDMESNGKSVTRDGEPVGYKTGIPVWGNVGSNSQHSFHQLLHQGTSLVPVDFIVGAQTCSDDQAQHELLVSNCLAQAQALMIGRQEDEVRKELTEQGKTEAEIEALLPHKVIAGNKPSTTIMYPKLCPSVLGQLIALYEQKIFTQSVIWNINPFDQWGVELGKQLSKTIIEKFKEGSDMSEIDPSTAGLIETYKSLSSK